jgi:hypothetical protein
MTKRYSKLSLLRNQKRRDDENLTVWILLEVIVDESNTDSFASYFTMLCV